MYVRERPVDRLIDLFVAMESLYGDRGGGVSYKVGMRCAFCLADAYEEKKRIKRLVRDASYLRNAVVHGDEIGQEKTQDIRKFIPGLMELIRLSICFFLDQQKQSAPIRDPSEIDDLILRGKFARK